MSKGIEFEDEELLVLEKVIKDYLLYQPVYSEQFLCTQCLKKITEQYYERQPHCELLSICNYKTGVCNSMEPDEGCYYYRYFKKLIEKENDK